MRHLLAAAAALTAASTLAGCIGCGVADQYARGTDGQWVVTRMFTYESPCPAFDEPEQLSIEIVDGVLAVTSADATLASQFVRTEGDRQLVDFTVYERWYTPESPTGFVAAPVTYSLELVPATARLEGTVTSAFPFDGETSATTCESQGAATGGRVE